MHNDRRRGCYATSAAARPARIDLSATLTAQALSLPPSRAGRRADRRLRPMRNDRVQLFLK